jgi:hypothetical protein
MVDRRIAGDSLMNAARLGLSQDGENLGGGDLANRPLADRVFGEAEKPFDFAEGGRRSAFALQLRDILIAERGESVAHGFDGRALGLLLRLRRSTPAARSPLASSRAVLMLTSGYRPSESSFSQPPTRYLSRQRREPFGLTSKCKPWPSARL